LLKNYKISFKAEAENGSGVLNTAYNFLEHSNLSNPIKIIVIKPYRKENREKIT
jgi:hypothetical protein